MDGWVAKREGLEFPSAPGNGVRLTFASLPLIVYDVTVSQVLSQRLIDDRDSYKSRHAEGLLLCSELVFTTICAEDVKKGVKGLSTKNNTLLILSETTLMTENAIGQELWLASHDQNNIPGGQRVRVKNGRERGKKKKNVWEQGTIDLNGFAGESQT
eukprot:1395268-Amorphochlora_amoeboformis.AAC.1